MVMSSDISKCKGSYCPLKMACHRFLAKSQDYQSYMIDIPFNGDKQECDYQIPVNQEDYK
jgi:hypothetical protein